MPTLLDEAKLDSLFSMFKGEPGTRKSSQALSYPLPQYWFSWDKKMNGLLLPMQKWGIDPRKITYDDYDDWDKPRAKLEQFQLNCPYKTIVIDSLTSAADGILRQGKKLKGKDAKKVNNIPVNSIEDYGAEDSALSELLALCKDIHQFHKVHVILIAHVMVVEHRNATTQSTHISRTIVTAGKRISLKIPAYCDEVYHFNVEKSVDTSQEGQYGLLTRHTGDDFARTTLPLDAKIIFGDKPLYETWVRPAHDKMKQEILTQHQPQITTPITPQKIGQ